MSDITAALAAPFDPKEVKFKPQIVQGNRAMALAFIDARVVQDRLDDVCGVEGWQDEYHVLAEGSVECRLRIKIGDEWIQKVDVGSPSEQPDGGDRMKAAFSDALKRAAVKFGVGRYLYRLPSQWCDYDPAKRQFTRPPQLPGAPAPARPAGGPAAPAGVAVVDAAKRAKVADAAVAAFMKAKSLDELAAAWKMLPRGFLAAQDDASARVVGAKNDKKLALLVDEIDAVADELGLDVVAVAKIGQSVGVSDIDVMTIEQAEKVLAKLKDQAEAERVAPRG